MLQTAFFSGLGGPELIVVFVVVLILFGPKRLPEIAKMFGKTMDTLRKSANDFKGEIMKIEHEPTSEQPYAMPPNSGEQGYIDTEALPSGGLPSEQESGFGEPVALHDGEAPVHVDELIKAPDAELPAHSSDAEGMSSDGGSVQPSTANSEPETRSNDRAG